MCDWSRSFGAYLTIVFAFWNGAAQGAAATSRPLVVATVRPLALLTQQLCDVDCEVVALVPVGQSEHTWQPGPKDVARFKQAVALVGVGLGFDDRWIARIAGNKKKTPTAFIGTAVKTLPWGLEEAETHAHHSHEEHGTNDPHIWFDPARMAQTVPLLVQTLAAALPAASDGLKVRAEKITKELGVLQKDIQQMKAGWRSEPVLVFHDALNYWADSVSVTIVPVMGGSGGHNISAKTLSRILKNFKDKKIAGVVVETVNGASQNLARDLNTKVIKMDFSASNASSYEEWMRAFAKQWDEFARK